MIVARQRFCLFNPIGFISKRYSYEKLTFYFFRVLNAIGFYDVLDELVEYRFERQKIVSTSRPSFV